jgi:AcrR family transcriptional regulator
MPTDKKLAIYAAALELIAENGFHSSPMSVLAKRANVAAGTIYTYFEGKDQLIASLYWVLREKLIQHLEIDLENTQVPYRERFRRFYYSFFEYLMANPKEFMFFEQFASSPFLHRIDKEELQKLNQPIIDFVRKGVVTMQLKDVPTRLLWNIVQAQVQTLVRLQLNGEMVIDSENLKGGFEICWEGVKK